jgi:hypothetical protein
MKKISALAAFFLFLCASSASQAKPKVIDFPDDFVGFYAQFRAAVATPDNEKLLPLMCFPFKSHEIGELVGERTRKFTPETFKKHNKLAELFVTDSIGEIRTPINWPDLGKVIYTDAQDFIAKNPDPRHPIEVDESYGRSISYTEDRAEISSLEFSKRQGRWCWSGASYLEDPIYESKHPRKKKPVNP